MTPEERRQRAAIEAACQRYSDAYDRHQEAARLAHMDQLRCATWCVIIGFGAAVLFGVAYAIKGIFK
jgi:hypothetical protein